MVTDFTDVSKSRRTGPGSHSSGLCSSDYDNDGLVDLLVCNGRQIHTDEKPPDVPMSVCLTPLPVPAPNASHSRPLQNMGNYRFKDVTAEVGLKPESWSGDATFAE